MPKVDGVDLIASMTFFRKDLTAAGTPENIGRVWVGLGEGDAAVVRAFYKNGRRAEINADIAARYVKKARKIDAEDP